MPKINISKAGVLKLLEKIKVNKATGPDGIPGNLLKMCASELASVFTLLFQASLDQGSVPSDWKEANILSSFLLQCRHDFRFFGDRATGMETKSRAGRQNRKSGTTIR